MSTKLEKDLLFLLIDGEIPELIDTALSEELLFTGQYDCILLYRDADEGTISVDRWSDDTFVEAALTDVHSVGEFMHAVAPEVKKDMFDRLYGELGEGNGRLRVMWLFDSLPYKGKNEI